jgi:hypothetical protein
MWSEAGKFAAQLAGAYNGLIRFFQRKAVRSFQ